MFGDMFKMLGNMKDMQAKLKEAQDKVALITAVGESGAGMVKVTVNGKKQIVKIDIEDDLMKVEDKMMLQDLIIAAVNKAQENVEVLTKEELKKSTEGLIPNIPGLDLESMFGGK